MVAIIKCGSRGSMGIMEGKIVESKAFKVKVVDTTGAGDSFDAGFTYYFVHKNRSLQESIKFANAVGALACPYVGGSKGKNN